MHLKDNFESQPMHATSLATSTFGLVAGKSLLFYWIIICAASAESSRIIAIFSDVYL